MLQVRIGRYVSDSGVYGKALARLLRDCVVVVTHGLKSPECFGSMLVFTLTEAFKRTTHAGWRRSLRNGWPGNAAANLARHLRSNLFDQIISLPMEQAKNLYAHVASIEEWDGAGDPLL